MSFRFLSEELDQKREKLNEIVRGVDELETEDYSEKLVEVNLKLDALTRALEFEKTEKRIWQGDLSLRTPVSRPSGLASMSAGDISQQKHQFDRNQSTTYETVYDTGNPIFFISSSAHF